MLKSKKIKTVKICPKCNSKNMSIYMGAVTGMRYKCKDCGYIGVLTIEWEKNFKKLGLDFKKKTEKMI